MPFLMVALNPPYNFRNTNYRYSPERTSHLVTARAGTGIPEKIINASPPLWSSIARRRHTWVCVPTPQLTSLGWYYPRPLWIFLWTPTIDVITPGGGFVHTLQPSLLVQSLSLSLSLRTIPVPLHTCYGWIIFRVGGCEQNETDGVAPSWVIMVSQPRRPVNPSQQRPSVCSTIFHGKLWFSRGVFALCRPRTCYHVATSWAFPFQDAYIHT